MNNYQDMSHHTLLCLLCSACVFSIFPSRRDGDQASSWIIGEIVPAYGISCEVNLSTYIAKLGHVQ
jgi:hypothetical protein